MAIEWIYCESNRCLLKKLVVADLAQWICRRIYEIHIILWLLNQWTTRQLGRQRLTKPPHTSGPGLMQQVSERNGTGRGRDGNGTGTGRERDGNGTGTGRERDGTGGDGGTAMGGKRERTTPIDTGQAGQDRTTSDILSSVSAVEDGGSLTTNMPQNMAPHPRRMPPGPSLSFRACRRPQTAVPGKG